MKLCKLLYVGTEGQHQLVPPEIKSRAEEQAKVCTCLYHLPTKDRFVYEQFATYKVNKVLFENMLEFNYTLPFS